MLKHAVFILLITKILARYDEYDDWGSNNQPALLTDMSTICVDDLRTDIYLPFGMGVADASVVVISDNTEYPNCMITYCSMGGEHGIYLIVVIEFPDHIVGPYNACQFEGSKIMIREPTRGDIDVCDEVNQLTFGYFATPVYTVLSNATNISVIITSSDLFETVKITVTSAQRKTEKCNENKEILCLISNTAVCVSIELLCDHNINCGRINVNDEDIRICDESRYKRLWLVVVSCTIMVMIIVFFSIHLLRACLPSVSNSFFIFNEDEDNKLILSTKFTAPPEALRQTVLPPRGQTQTLLFRFTSVPVTHSALSTSPKNNEKKTIFEAGDQLYETIKIESNSETHKKGSRKTDELLNDLPIRRSSNQLEQIERKPRFETDFIQMMDYVDVENYAESSRDHQRKASASPRKHEMGSKNTRKSKGEIDQRL